MLEYEDRETVDKFFAYVRLVERPELDYLDAVLRLHHEALVGAMIQFLKVEGTEMVPDHDPSSYVATLKDANSRGQWTEDLDKRRDKQIAKLSKIVADVWAAWKTYAHELSMHYPDVVHAPERDPSTTVDAGDTESAKSKL